jgi:cyclohexanone monooxygenase
MNPLRPDLIPQPLDVLIVGAGFAGLAMLRKLRGTGLDALAIDAAPHVGGTWYHNRYPGARVDIESLEYSFGFDEGLQQEWCWSERYASQPELLRYAEHVADRFGLRPHIALKTRLERAVFDEASGRWEAQAEGGRAWSARLLVMATGGLSTPNTPAFPGLERFGGRVLHTADWPHEPIDFTGQRVGVVGTGSSGLQLIPLVARQAAALTVFQRTAAYAVPAWNGPLDRDREVRIKADYGGFRARNRRMRTGFGSEVPAGTQSALAATPEEREAEFERRWRIGGFCLLGAYADLMLDTRANALVAEFVRTKIRSIVHDAETATLLSPRQAIGCKRLCVDSGGYYETFNLPHVKLVDVSERPIEAIAPEGPVVAGEVHPVDVLVLATGFDAMTGTLKRIDLRGRGGLRIQDKWQPGPLNYLGLMTAGFPNLFHVAGAGSSAAFTNVIVSIEHHVDWIANCIAHLRAHGHATVEASETAESAWVRYVTQMAGHTVFPTCNSWYLGANIPGKPRMFMPLVGGFPLYSEKCAEVAARGYEGFAFA